MTDLIHLVQQDEIDSELIELFDITLPGYQEGGSGTYYLCSADVDIDSDGDSDIVFNGKTYVSIPINIDGIEFTAQGAYARPTLTIANIPNLTKSITNSETLLEDMREAGTDSFEQFDRNQDLLGTQVRYRKTLKSKLSTGEEFPSQVFFVDRIASENSLFVAFELVSPMDVEGVTLPHRMVIGRYCSWQYQGQEDGLGGGCTWGNTLADQHSFFREDDTKITGTIDEWADDEEYFVDDIVKTTEAANHTIYPNKVQIWQALYDHGGSDATARDPRNYRAFWKRIDLCGKTLKSCKIRYQGNSTDTSLNQDIPLFFGGFPGSKKFR